MVLEATMIVLDNSEWMRNGDFSPSRLEAQIDTVNILFRSKTGSNPENTVGIMSMANRGPKVLVTLTSDLGKVLNAVNKVPIGGTSKLITGIQVAQLALKHRQNKNQRQRVIVFVGSPVEENEKDLVKLAKKMKKNNVAVDIINFGEADENEAKLLAFNEAVNSSSNSHLLTIQPGPQLLSDVVISSPIISEDGNASGVSRSDATNFEFGVDPTLEPELAMALRLSLEEERARLAALSGEAPESAENTQVVDNADDDQMDDSEEAQLQRALALSLMADTPVQETGAGQSESNPDTETDNKDKKDNTIEDMED